MMAVAAKPKGTILTRASQAQLSESLCTGQLPTAILLREKSRDTDDPAMRDSAGVQRGAIQG